MDERNYLGRTWALLVLTFLICLGLYGLSDTWFGYKIRKVDLLSDFKVKTGRVALDSLIQQLAEMDTLRVDSMEVKDSVARSSGIDSTTLALRDSLYKAVYSTAGADSLGSHIEDYSSGHIGLKRFFAALRGREELGRPVRVAFLGDSFIEGDILVADVRSGLQKEFGGRGVGFVPVTSVAERYRPTVDASSEGWTTWSLLTDHEHAYTLSGLMFEATEEEASIHLKTTGRYSELSSVSSLKLIYEQNKYTKMCLSTNGSDTIRLTLPPTSVMSQYEVTGTFHEANFTFKDTEGFRALGVALEDTSGIVVDNFSLRGSSGLNLERLDSAYCQALNKIRPYDLIVLQYGLNVASDSVMNYNWYSYRMLHVIQHIQSCFPDADLLMLGVSDRSRQVNGEYETMPAVLALLYAQRQVAKRAGIPFWNVFGAMGGENSMVYFVEREWASKDYTHLSFGGGREVARSFLKALLAEKEFYDEAEKVVY